MPEWLHDRAKHILRKNPDMPEGEAFAIATQQSHALGKTPLIHVAGPTAAGKTTLAARLQAEHPSLHVRDLDDFDDEASAALLPGKSKKDYTLDEIRRNAVERQRLLDAYLQDRKDAPVLLVGHHNEGPTSLNIAATHRFLLNPGAGVSVKRRYARNATAPVEKRLSPDDRSRFLTEARDDVKQLGQQGYSRKSSREIAAAVARHMKTAASESKTNPVEKDKTSAAMLSAFLDELPKTAAEKVEKPHELSGYAAVGKLKSLGRDGVFHVFNAQQVKKVGPPQTEIRWQTKTAAAIPLRSKESIGALVSPSLVRVNTLPSPAPSDQEFGDEKESVKVGYSVSQYSGPLSMGRFKQESYLPPFNMPQLKTAGPPSEVGRVKRASEDDLDFYGDSDMPKIKQESHLPPFRAPALRRKMAGALVGTSYSPGKNVGGGGTTAGSGGAGGLLGPPQVKFSPGSQLAKSQNVAKVPTTPPGPTVATLAKPVGYGKPMPGATKTLSA